MAVYDPEALVPEALVKAQSIYRDVVFRLIETSGRPEDATLEMVAQDILRLVIAINRKTER